MFGLWGRGQLIEEADERLRLFLVGSADEHLLWIRLLPVDLESQQLRGKSHAGLPERERLQNAPARKMDEAVPAARGFPETSMVAPEDSEVVGGDASNLVLPVIEEDGKIGGAPREGGLPPRP